MAISNNRRGRPDIKHRLSAYLRHHLQSLTFSLGKIYHSPASTIMTVAVIGITLSLPGGFYLFLQNMESVSGDLRSSAQISLFLDIETGEQHARALERDIRADSRVQSTQFIPRDQSLKQFREDSGFGKSIDTLSSNPLPHTILVEPNQADSFVIQNLLKELQVKPEVEIAKLDTEWLERLYTIIEIARRGVIMITLLFGCAVLLVIGNTIRLDIQNRYQEIIVAKMIGATDAFIRRPFLYGGLWYGLLGGIISWLIVELGYLSISGPLQRLNLLYQSELHLTTYSLEDCLILIASSTSLGLAGSWIAVTRHLDRIEPT